MRALYEQVYESLKQDILSSKYKIGERIPSEKEITESFSVSRITSKKALEKLVQDGLVYRQRGKGTFVLNTSQTSVNIEKSNRTKPVFGLIVPMFSESYGTGIIEAIEEEANGKCMIMLKRSLGILEREEKAIKELLAYGVDGLIIFPAKSEHYSAEILKMIVNKFPFVLIDRNFKGIAAPSVSTDNFNAAKNGIKYLFDSGHEQIGILLAEDFEITAIEERLKGIVSAFAENKVSVNKAYWCDTIKRTPATEKKDIEWIKQHLINNPNLTALFALEYKIATLAKIAVEQLNKKVPEDISILSFDSPTVTTMEWHFTHIKQNEGEIGRRAIQKLLHMQETGLDSDKEQIRATLHDGNSTMPLVKVVAENQSET
ncbi:DNA-binding transcriptional regulator, LacI/PurR family [Gracilibacillus orientalis]|uniref:DNA-binding transcriptional regulator, LacI/PurR family n=1 Tax=Gracilibacillus orientalis TaxID=334253 RepID=A0A1I4LIG4_9BACI|nr:GntR family transcriptional regulator [Gracilibacillus orientalis]SFL90824.1 DNA-binding transcriptional regulator, LacI/PurR family [Gracilibacillus orientalis]